MSESELLSAQFVPTEIITALIALPIDIFIYSYLMRSLICVIFCSKAAVCCELINLSVNCSYRLKSVLNFRITVTFPPQVTILDLEYNNPRIPHFTIKHI